MTYTKACEIARLRANRTAEIHVIVQAKNGQWMVERHSFVFENARGRMMYPDPRFERFDPE